jgi:hypothetical protein
MAWEFPAVSQTRIEFWKQPQYTRKGMLIFTILFGFFGFHHFLLRSPQTGLLFFIANLLSLGYCYFYDIIQLYSTPVKDLNEYGMSLPWGAAGIAKGMWKCGDQKQTGGGNEEPPNPWWFFAYSLLLPLQPLAKLFTGDTSNALISFLNLTIMPFGFIMFALVVAYEYFNLFARPANVFMNGIERPFPYTFLGFDKKGNNPKITIEQPPNPSGCTDDNLPFHTRIWKMTMQILGPLLQAILPPQVAIAIGAVSTATTQGAKTAETLLQTAEVASEQAQVALETSGKVIKKIGNVVEQIPSLANAPLAQATALAQNPQSLLTKQVGSLSLNMKGGGLNLKALQTLNESETSTFDYAVFGLIAAVIGGGFLLHTGRSFADVLHQSTGQTDTPPNKS